MTTALGALLAASITWSLNAALKRNLEQKTFFALLAAIFYLAVMRFIS